MKKQIQFYASIIFMIVVMGGCAGQFPPSGGPRDSIAPTIISTFPASNSLNFNGNYFSISFSEFVKTSSVENALFISPSLGTLTYNWSGTSVDIYYSLPLKNKTTYVVIVGTDVVDINNNNHLKETYSFAFSTGNVIDSSEIVGRVYDTQPSRIFIFGYNSRSVNFDTLSPHHVQPDYISQTSDDGKFTLSHLAYGTYRIFAIRDVDRNLLFDGESDEIGIAQNDIFLNDSLPKVGDVFFQMERRDMTAPFMISIESMHSTEVVVTMSEPMNTGSFKNNITIVDSLTKIPLQIYDAYSDISISKKIFVQTYQQTNTAYHLECYNVKDTSGNEMRRELSSAFFAGNIAIDTITPRIIYSSLTDSMKEVSCTEQFLFTFNTSIAVPKLTEWIFCTDSSGKTIGLKYEWKSPRTVLVIPEQKLSSAVWYSMALFCGRIESKSGNKFQDSVVNFRFKTMDENILGVLKGRIKRNEKLHSARIIILAKNIEMQKTPLRTAEANSNGEFVFENLYPGKHVVSAFSDDNGDGKYSYGNILPFIPAEKFVVHTDTIKIRSRWSVEGVIIKF